MRHRGNSGAFPQVATGSVLSGSLRKRVNGGMKMG